jgi:hypothetical protein
MRSSIVWLCAALTLGGCDGYDDDGGTTGPSPVASIEVALPSEGEMTSAGDARAVVAVAKNADQSVVQSPPLTWTSDAPAVATVVGAGATATITAVGDGIAKISASTGSVEGTVTVTVRRRVASVVVSSPSPLLTVGSTAQLVTVALDARGNPLPNVTGFTFASSNPGSVVVSNTGLMTALFAFAATPSAIITATLTRDGVTVSDTAGVSVGAPRVFDFGALMLSEYVMPTRAPTAGAGVGYFGVDGARVNYTVTWSALSGPAAQVHIHGPGTVTDVVGTLLDFAPGAQTTTFGALTGSFGAADIRAQGGRPAISLDSLVTLLRTGNAYLDVHTAAFPDGEVRGQFVNPFR